jgi:hypothetical protein
VSGCQGNGRIYHKRKLKPADLTTKNWGGGMACAGRSKECTIVSADV